HSWLEAEKLGIIATCCTAVGLTLADKTLCSAPTVRPSHSTVLLRAPLVVVPSSGAARLRTVADSRVHVFYSARLVRQSSRRCSSGWLHHSHAHPRTSDPPRAVAARCAWHRADRYRQDRCVHVADADDARERPRPGTHAAHAHPRADARARRSGSGELREIRR